jgi:hypothetical protein
MGKYVDDESLKHLCHLADSGLREKLFGWDRAFADLIREGESEDVNKEYIIEKMGRIDEYHSAVADACNISHEGKLLRLHERAKKLLEE